MDDNSHVFLIKDKIRCIQKKIMDQLAADLNNALNDAHMLTSSLPNLPSTSSSSLPTILKIKRRRKRQINNESSQQKTEASGSTTPENNRTHLKQTIVSDSDDMAVTTKTRSSSLVAASESDSASQNNDLRRHRRPFKKPPIPSSFKAEQSIKLTRCPSIKTTDSTTMNPYVRRRRRNCRSDCSSQQIDVDENHLTPSTSSTLSLAIKHTNYAGKRKRSRAIIHDDFRLRNNSVHDYDMTCIDDANLTNFSSSSSLNLSDSDKDPCVTSNEADDEQSDWPRDESSVPRVISWWDDNDQEKSDDDDDDDNGEKMLTTTDGTLQKIVNGALNMVLANSKNSIQNRMKTFVHREMLTGNRRHVGSKNTYTHPHPKRHVRLLKDARRSHHSSYSHKRVKNDHLLSKQSKFIEQKKRSLETYSRKLSDDIIAPIDSTNLVLDQNSTTTSVQNNYRQSSTYEHTLMDTCDRMESEQICSFSSPPSQI